MLTSTLFLVLMLCAITACKKEKCQECYIDETNSFTGVVTTTSIGKKCGNDLKNTDGNQYTGVSGPARTYCK